MTHKNLRIFFRATVVLLLAMSLMAVPSAAAHEEGGFPEALAPGQQMDGAPIDNTHSLKHFTQGASKPAKGPDLHTQNLHLLASLPKSGVVNSDLAFWGQLAFAGNYRGFRVIDISDPETPQVLADVLCNGPQGDVSVWENLLFLSNDTPQTTEGCAGSANTNYTRTPNAFEGIRIFDVSNPASPQFVKAVRTDCGSHTHTLVPDLANNRVLLYIASYALTTGSLGPDCQNPHAKISIVAVPLDAPQNASVTEHPLDPGTTALVGNDILPGFGLLTTTGCHDINVFLELNLAAASCLSEAQLWDISNPANPVFLYRIDNPNVEVWHNGAFTWDGEVVVFADELDGAALPGGCVDPGTLGGRLWFYQASNGAELGSFKIPRSQPANQLCTAHNFNILPTRSDRYVLIGAWYQAGTSVVDFTDPASPVEIGYYDAQVPTGANTWSSYWYNNFIYASDIGRGVDIFLLSDDARRGAVRFDYLNPQTQVFTIP